MAIFEDFFKVWWWKWSFTNCSEIEWNHTSLYLCFCLAVLLLGTTCWKLVILEILMLYRRSSHYNIIIGHCIEWIKDQWDNGRIQKPPVCEIKIFKHLWEWDDAWCLWVLASVHLELLLKGSLISYEVGKSSMVSWS